MGKTAVKGVQAALSVAAAWTEGRTVKQGGRLGNIKKSRIHGADRVIDGNLRRPI